MQTFGSKVFVKDRSPNKGKFDPRAEEGIFMWYDLNSKAYRVYVLESGKLVISGDVKFMHEPALPHGYEDILDEEEGEIKKITIELNNDDSESDKEITEKRKTLRAIRGSQRRKVKDPKHNKLINDSQKIRKRRATLSWENLVGQSKRGSGRPRIMRSGSVGRPRKEYREARIDFNTDSSDTKMHARWKMLKIGQR